MLGLIKSERNWQWAAYGKHPSVRDYFRVGRHFPSVNSFSEWIEKGYDMAASKKNIHEICSWRFWARESRKQNIVCGLLRDSNDSIGRPFPLMIIGTGPLKGWEEQWDLLPLACEKTWDQIEYLSTHIFDDFKKLGIELQNIKPPRSEWSELAARRGNFIEFKSTQGGYSIDLKNLGRQALSLSEKAESFVYLNQAQTSLISLWHFLFKTHVKTLPNSIFMGGTLEKAYMAFFKRPLILNDFIQLWTISSSEVLKNGSLIAGKRTN